MILDKSGVRLYPMTYDEYLEVRKKEITEKIAIKELKPIKTQPIKTTRKPNNAFKIAKAEEEIEELESKLKFINEEMALNSDNADRLYELFVEKESIEKQLEDSYELWETLNT